MLVQKLLKGIFEDINYYETYYSVRMLFNRIGGMQLT